MGDLDDLIPFMEQVAARLTPARRVQLARKVAHQLRRENYLRAINNLSPDGSAMEPRKPKEKRKRKKLPPPKKRMFQRIEMAKHMRVNVMPDHVELAFRPRVAPTAAVHHFGLDVPIFPQDPNSIRVRYPARPLLGIGPGDEHAILLAAMEFLEGKGLA